MNRPAGALLALEASQRIGGVALRAPDGRTHVEQIGEAVPDQERLLPAVDRAFAALGVAPASLQAVFVSAGPGGFTGLRVAMATAQGLSLGTGCVTVSVPSALVAACTAGLPRDGRVLVALAAKEEEAWIAGIPAGCSAANLASAAAPAADGTLVTAATLPALAAGAAVLLADRHLPRTLAEAAASLRLPLEPLRLDAVACLEAGAAMLDAGLVTPADLMLPIYPRIPEAVRLWRARTGQPAQPAQPAPPAQTE